MAILDFKKWFSGLGKNFDDRLTSFISSYGRRMAEPYYDQFSKTNFFQKLKEAPKPTRYAIEAIVNAISAILEEKIREDTPIRKIAKEIFMDSSSELNKRLLNGEPVKKIISDSTGKMDLESQEKLAALFFLDDDQLKEFFEWLVRSPENEKSRYLKELRGFSKDELMRFAQLDERIRDDYLRAVKQTPKNNPLAGFFNPFRQKMIDYLNEEKKGG